MEVNQEAPTRQRSQKRHQFLLIHQLDALAVKAASRRRLSVRIKGKEIQDSQIEVQIAQTDLSTRKIKEKGRNRDRSLERQK